MIEINRLDEFLICDPEKGVLIWRPRAREHFATWKSWRVWNKRFADRPALNASNGKGYLRGMVAGKKEFAHRVIFAMAHGRWPSEVDHINGDRTDNRIANLREVTHAENTRNARRRRDNKTGVPGVYRRGRKFIAMIRSGSAREYLGGFGSFEEAAAARAFAELRLGFHKNHGRSA